MVDDEEIHQDLQMNKKATKLQIKKGYCQGKSSSS